MKFQDKFYDIIGHKKCPSSEKSAEKCIWRKSNFHGILPTHTHTLLHYWDWCTGKAVPRINTGTGLRIIQTHLPSPGTLEGLHTSLALS